MLFLPFNSGNPFQKLIDLGNSLAQYLPYLGWTLLLVVVICMGIMFFLSDRLAEKAKQQIFRVLLGSGILSGASFIVDWLKSGF